jgi:hypothetical protein
MKIKEREFEELIQELKSVALQLGAEVRFERGDFKGGYCILNDNKVIVVNKMATLQRKVIILSMALKEIGVDEIYLTPRLRDVIEEMAETG